MIDAQPIEQEEKFICPHCKTPLTYCNTPPIHVGDGLGWGSEYFHVCLNDDCPLYVNGWKFIELQYGHSASYRYMLTPGSSSGTPMMVGSPDAFKGCIIDPVSRQRDQERFQKQKEAIAALDTCVAEGNLAPVLYLILDEAAELNSRLRACDLILKLNDLACFDPIRNHKFKNTNVAQTANLALHELLKAHFKKECPHCAEIIKTQAKVCKHCRKEL